MKAAVKWKPHARFVWCSCFECENIFTSRDVTTHISRCTKGSFTYDVITLGGGGGFQMMTNDDEGEGGVLANDDVIIGTTIFGKFLGFIIEFFLNFLKNLQNLDKNFQLFKEIFN